MQFSTVSARSEKPICAPPVFPQCGKKNRTHKKRVVDTTSRRQTAGNVLHQREKRATEPQPSPEMIKEQTMIKELLQLNACFKNCVRQTDTFRDSER